MDITDYSAAANKNREKFAKEVAKIREHHAKELGKAEQRHKVIQKNQLEGFQAKADKMRQENEDRAELYSKMADDVIANKRKQYQESKIKQQEEFTKNTTEQRRNFNDRLNQLTDSYYNLRDRDVKAADERIKHVKEHTNFQRTRDKDLYRKNVDKLQDNFQKMAKVVQNESHKEKAAMVKRQQDEFKTLSDNYIQMRNLQNETFRKNTDELKRIQKTELGNRDSHHENLVKDIRRKSINRHKKLTTNFSELTERLNRNSSIEMGKLVRQSERNMRKLERNYAMDANALKRDADKRVFEARKQGQGNTANAVNSFNERIKGYQTLLEDNHYRNQRQRDMMARNTRTLLDYKDKAGRELLEKEQTKGHKFRKEIKNKFKVEKDKMIGQFKKDVKANKDRTDLLIANEKLQSQGRYERQRESYADSLTLVNQKNKALIKQMQKDFSQEQTKFFEKVKRDKFNEKEGLRTEMKRNLLQTVNTYELKVANLEAQLKTLVDKYENKIENISKQADKDLQNQKIIEHERRMEDRRSTKAALEAKDQDKAREVAKIKERFKKKVEKLKAGFDVHIAKLTTRYEDLLERSSIEHRNEMRRKLTEAQRKLERFISDTELQREAERNQFEVKIEKMRMAHMNKEAMRSATKFKA